MSFEELKKFAISDILSVSGKEKLSRVIDSHISNLIEIALIKGAASRQGEVDALNALGEMSEQKVDDLVLRNTELQKRIDRVVHILTYTNHASTPLCDELGEILKGQNNG